MECLAPPGPLPREPHPEGAVEGPEPRSLRAVAEQGELLPERQILKRKISVGPERSTRRAQESEYEGHCAPASLGVIPSSSVTIEFWQTTARFSITRSARELSAARTESNRSRTRRSMRLVRITAVRETQEFSLRRVLASHSCAPKRWLRELRLEFRAENRAGRQMRLLCSLPRVENGSTEHRMHQPCCTTRFAFSLAPSI